MLIILGSAHGVYAQSMDSFREQTDITPSVETWKMTRHGGLSPSLYTGAMQWSLPLYVYKDYDFELPVSLAYSYDGFRPGESSGSVGLGWTLNVGGVITREVRGLRDECLKQVENGTYLYGYYYAWKKSLGTCSAPKEFLRKELLYFNNITPEDMSFIELLRDDLPNDIIVSRPTAYNEKYETEPDIFRFNFCGHSGEFRFGENGRIDIFCTDEPECDFKIEVGEMTGPDCETFNFKITTSDGYIYILSELRKIPGNTAKEVVISQMTTRVLNWRIPTETRRSRRGNWPPSNRQAEEKSCSSTTLNQIQRCQLSNRILHPLSGWI